MILRPKYGRRANVASSTTGTAKVGISVARKLCRNRYMTRKTSTTASRIVCTTDSIEASTTGVVS
ncbi:hypothetical protein D3C80_2111300 [compost metagenome]